MEKIPNNNEQAERREWLVANLKSLGIENPEAKAVLDAWLVAEQDRRPADQSPEALDPVQNFGSGLEASIQFGLLLKDAGMMDEAWEQLNFAWNDANQMDDHSTRARIEGIMNTFDS